MQNSVTVSIPTQAFIQVSAGTIVSPLTLASLGDIAPVILTTSLPNGRIDISYSFQLEASGEEPITWSTDENFPDGWTLSSSGLITGYPTEIDVYEFDITATNDFGSDTKSFSLTIQEALAGIPILVRRSNTPGKVPQISDLLFGELAVNFYDGKLFFKRNRGSDEIVVIEPPSDAVLEATLTGLSTEESTEVLDSDSLLEGIGKLQAQINQLTSGLSYRGTWNASTNSPTLVDGSGTPGYFYIVTTAGSQNLGNGSINFSVGDKVAYGAESTRWERIPASE